ncbi:MAG: hypothetical protein ACKVU4_04365 [Phycisphaerales bacterium]
MAAVHRTLVLAAALGCLTAAGVAQTRPPTPPAPVLIPLADSPLRLESVGLEVLLPHGAISQVQRAGSVETVQITPPLPDESWAVTISTPRSANAQHTPEVVAREGLKQLIESVGVPMLDPDTRRPVRGGTSGAEVLQDVRALRIDAAPEEGSRFYVKLPRGGGESPSVRGYTVFRVAPGRFVVFELFTSAGEFERVRAYYETIVANARFSAQDDRAMSRGAAVESGIALLAGLSAEDMRAVVESRADLLARTFKESPTGADADAEEIGYQRVRARTGFRGELDTRRAASTWDAADRQEGYLVTVEGRQLLRDQGVMVDSRGTYFMTPDRTEEAWVLDMGVRPLADAKVRKPRDTGSWNEVGARSGGSMTITVARSGEPGQTVRPTVPDRGYISQLEMLLMPYILLRTKRPGDYGFYAYQSQNDRVALRKDTIEQHPDRPGVWMLTTRATEDSEPRTATYTERGELIRVTLPNRAVIEPVTPDRLTHLWRTKGLPMN